MTSRNTRCGDILHNKPYVGEKNFRSGSRVALGLIVSIGLGTRSRTTPTGSDGVPCVANAWRIEHHCHWLMSIVHFCFLSTHSNGKHLSCAHPNGCQWAPQKMSDSQCRFLKLSSVSCVVLLKLNLYGNVPV